MTSKSHQIIINAINSLAKSINHHIKFMEVCGTHTQVIAQFGLKKILPENIELVSGPGCPVCVTAQQDIDAIVELALAGIPIVAYGDVLRVPGTKMSLEQARTKGAWVQEIYSVEEIYNLPKKNVVFFGLGFETTAPMTAAAIKKGVNVYSTHKLFPPAMDALLKSGEISIDGFLDPGHVSTIIGTKPYQNLKNKDGKAIPQVITGFELEDVLTGIYLLLKQIRNKEAKIENEYSRSVKPEGNIKALKLINEVFDVGNGNWRGFGIIPKSGLEINKKYAQQDAKIIYKKILNKLSAKSYQLKATPCRCGEVLRGIMKPQDCKLFRKVCTPQNPFGPCMVSHEGACNATFKFQ